MFACPPTSARSRAAERCWCKMPQFVVAQSYFLFVIQVEFTREVEEDDKSRSLKHNKRILFQRMAPYPQRKVITFNRYTDDFEFYVNYGDLTFLSQDDLRWVEPSTWAGSSVAFCSCPLPPAWVRAGTLFCSTLIPSSLSLLLFLCHQSFWFSQSHYCEAKGSWGQFQEALRLWIQRHQSTLQHGWEWCTESGPGKHHPLGWLSTDIFFSSVPLFGPCLKLILSFYF